MEMVKRLKQFWAITEGEERKLLARSLFEEVIYDLDKQQIVDFRLKPWADQFLFLRIALYANEDTATEDNDNPMNQIRPNPNIIPSTQLQFFSSN